MEDSETEEPGDEIELESDLDSDQKEEFGAGTAEYVRATDSDADLEDMDLATASDARQTDLATPSDLALFAAGASGNRRSVGGLERQREFSGRRNPGSSIPD